MNIIKVNDYFSLELFITEPDTNPQGSVGVVGSNSFIRSKVWFNMIPTEQMFDGYFRSICWTTFNDAIIEMVVQYIQGMELETSVGPVTDDWMSAEYEQYVSVSAMGNQNSTSRVINRAPTNHTLNNKDGSLTYKNLVLVPIFHDSHSPNIITDGFGARYRVSGIKLSKFKDSPTPGFDPSLIDEVINYLKWNPQTVTESA